MPVMINEIEANIEDEQVATDEFLAMDELMISSEDEHELFAKMELLQQRRARLMVD